MTITRRGGFTGPIGLAVGGLPAGVTASPATIAGDTATLVLATAANAVPGTFPLTVTATGTGVAAQSAALTLTVTTAPVATGSFAIALATPTISVAQGASTSATLNVTRTAPFAGGVTVAVSGVPAGLTVTPPSAAVTGGSGAITIAASPTLAPGTYPITVTVTGTGVTTQTTTLTVTVTAAAATGGLSISVTPTTITLPQNGTATATVAITRTGSLTGAVDISVGGLPPGVTYTVTSSLLSRQSALIRTSADPVTGNSATIRFTANGSAPTGAFSFTVTASAPGVATQATTVQASVTPAVSTGGNVALAFCTDAAPIWVGVQSEGGAWQRATLGANGQGSVNVTGARGAIAYVVQSGTGFTTTITYGTPAELATSGSTLCAAATGGKTLNGTVAGLAGGDQATIALGGATVGVSTGTTYTLTNVAPGPRDLLALRNAFSFSGTSISLTPTRAVLRRNVNIASGGTIPTIDFNGSDSFVPVSAQLSVTGLTGGESVVPFVALQTANGTGAAFYTGLSGITGGSGGTSTIYGVPSDRLIATDYHILTAVAFNANGASIDQTQGRGAGVLFKTISNRTLALSPALTTPSASLASSTPYPRPRVQLARQSEYADALNASFSQTTTGAVRDVAITALASFLQGGTTWDITVPDLTAAGYDPTWALRPGTQTTYAVSASGGAGPLVGGPAAEGAAFRYAFRTGSITTLNAARAVRR